MGNKILYIFPESSTFIRKDIGFLSNYYRVLTPDHNWKIKNQVPLNFIRQFLFLCRNLRGSKAVFVMFGGYWSFLPALMGKITGIPVFIIPGGTDCVSFPSLNYGSLRKPVMRTFIRWSFQLSTKLLPVDESLVLSGYTYLSDADFPKQGFMYFFPRLRTPYRVIHNGFDPDFFSTDPAAKRAESFIAVAPVNNMTRVRVKGVDLVIHLARRFAGCTFTLVGIADEVLQALSPLPPNLTVYPLLPKEKFISLLARSRFVLQLSISEGFPNALCEAMLCQCIPVGSAVGAIPSIIGDTGFVIASPEREYLEKRLEEILGTEPGEQHRLGLMARNRIAGMYHISRREKAFLEILEDAGD
jgi:glycosyltransferase involved in cell wall biosynthesis